MHVKAKSCAIGKVEKQAKREEDVVLRTKSELAVLNEGRLPKKE